MAVPLADASDVEDVWRPLTDDERIRVGSLLIKASALLRQLMPNLDTRMALFATDPTTRMALDPVIVATVVATAVKDYVTNPAGAASETETVGPYSHSLSYVLRGEKGPPRGVLGYSPALLAQLEPTVPESEARQSIRTKPALAPWPLGRYGGPNPFGSDYPDRIVPVAYGSDGTVDESVPRPYEGRP